MKKRTSFGIFALLVVVTAAVVATPLLSGPRTARTRVGTLAKGVGPGGANIGDAIIVATNSVWLKRDATVTGDVVVNDVNGGEVVLVPGWDVSVGRNASVIGKVKAGRVQLERDSSVNGVCRDTLDNKGATSTGPIGSYSTADGTANCDGTPPIFDLPECRASDPRGDNVFVGAGQIVELPAGQYNDVTIAQTGTLILRGEYDFRSVAPVTTASGQCLFPCRQIQFTGPSDVAVEQQFDMGKDAFVGPQGGSFSGSLVVINVNGLNGGLGEPTSLPAAATLGQSSDTNANYCVPNGTFLLDKNSTFNGAIIARDVQIDGSGSLDSAFGDKPPVAEPQTVTTVLDSVSIKLTCVDPEGTDVTFSTGPGPSIGTLTGLTPIVPDPVTVPNDGEDPNTDCNAEPEKCSTTQPPITMATVTYTYNDPVPDPDDLAAREDSFTFSCEDGAGLVGMAVVNINPFDNSTAPVITDVSAADLETDTVVDTPVTIVLQGEGPDSELPLVFTIQSLPTVAPDGSLKDSDDNTIGSAPYTLPTPTVKYTPPSGFTGSTSFDYSVGGNSTPACAAPVSGPGGVVCDVATVTIGVDDPAELGPDQSVTTTVNTPISIPLIGNPGGVGDGGGTAGLSIAPSKVIGCFFNATTGNTDCGAAIAGNVSDADGNGFGDGRDNLPGPAPVLIAAGVDVNLGAGSGSGSVNDPAGDATNSTSDDPANPDIVSATASTDGVNLNLSIRFVAAGFSSSTSRGSFVIDIDEDPGTGFPGIDAANNDSALMGVEYLVNIGANLGANAEVLQFVSLPNTFTSLGTVSATVLSDGYDVSIPLSTLGGDEGRLTFKAETQSFLGPGFTGILDYAPDVGLAPGQVTGGVKGIARIEIEWNISSFTSSFQSTGALPSRATVNLTTEKGTVDSLNTSFFVGTADEDGLLTVGDFQNPAVPVSGAVMPVPAVPTGTEGTFSFVVTSQLHEAIKDGFSHLTIQGRVDESLSGGGFERGLQIHSTADGNLPASKEPQLIVESGESFFTPITFTLRSLPTSGTLSRFVSGALSPVSVGSTFEPGVSLLYSPSFNFIGNDSFGIDVQQGSVIDSALVSISVVGVLGTCQTNEAACDDGR